MELEGEPVSVYVTAARVKDCKKGHDEKNKTNKQTKKKHKMYGTKDSAD